MKAESFKNQHGDWTNQGNPSLSRHQTQNLWWQKLIALIALVNLFLVIFNLSYLPLRDIYLRYTPVLTQVYDPVKGIKPHPDTEAYLQTVTRLE